MTSSDFMQFSDPSIDPRRLVWHMLHAITAQRAPLDEALEQLHESELEGRDRAFARQLLMCVLRHYGEIVAVLQPKLKTPLTGNVQPVHDLLALGVAQLLWLGTPAHAAIDQAVQLCKQEGFVHQAGMVNAVLRRVSEEREALLASSQPTYNLPSWLKGTWRKTYGREVADAIAMIHTQEPPLDITVRGEVDSWAQQLEGDVLLGNSIRRANAPVMQLPGYDAGQWWVQDLASTLPARLLGDVAGLRVVDLCTAPGGKSMQLATAGAQVTAVDRSARRMKRLEENTQRLGLEINRVVADAMQWQPDIAPDAVMLDAPCTATGTARRHPDLLLHRSEKEVPEMVALQRDLLHHTLSWMKPGSMLVYSVCSLQPEEGEQNIEALLAARSDVRLHRLEAATLGIPDEWINPQGCLRTLPHFWAEKGGMDGFFAALLGKVA